MRKDAQVVSAAVSVDFDPVEPVARVSAGDAVAVVKQGEWSDWLPLEFPLLGLLANAHGMVRIYVKQLHPNLEIYVSPVNVNPSHPDLPISYPASLSSEMGREEDAFFTLGIAEDTSALRQGVFDMPEYLVQSRLVLADEIRLLRYSLDHYSSGLLFFYFSSIDQNSHVLWNQHDAELAETYRAVDGAVGEVLRAQPDADLVVMSDHGFTTFDRAVNLNTWLVQHGYMKLNGPGDQEMFGGVDWSQTKAYAVGLNGLYVNLATREQHGVVNRSERPVLLKRISEELLAFRDPINGQAVVEAVSIPHEQADEVAPDLIIGYARGYRGSWQAALGSAPDELVTDNNDAWIGDHCINPADVPGVLFSNRAIRVGNPELKDLTVSVLSIFGIGPGPRMMGRMVF
jgi:predicted AlkP superfamily phosphohydrolase/phosphomutase